MRAERLARENVLLAAEVEGILGRDADALRADRGSHREGREVPHDRGAGADRRRRARVWASAGPGTASLESMPVYQLNAEWARRCSPPLRPGNAGPPRESPAREHGRSDPRRSRRTPSASKRPPPSPRPAVTSPRSSPGTVVTRCCASRARTTGSTSRPRSASRFWRRPRVAWSSRGNRAGGLRAHRGDRPRLRVCDALRARLAPPGPARRDGRARAGDRRGRRHRPRERPAPPLRGRGQRAPVDPLNFIIADAVPD
jgi:hypothetical protein